MPLNFLLKLVFSIIDLLKGSIIFSIPAFVFTVAGVFIGKELMNRYKLSWLLAALLSTFAITAVLVFIIYFTPVLSALGQDTIGEIPAGLAPTVNETVASAILIPLRLLFVSFLIALLFLPLEIIGSFIFEWLSSRYKKMNFYVRLYASVLSTVFISIAIILFALYGVLGINIIAGVLYLIFYGFAY